ncbi:MAG: glycogen synthase GlgA [Salinisphaera sp.]|jgi:starch synthase|nr:glycogen synthase GlgA [Salinisphaera sp.]
MKVLYVASELFPLVKTGGLADVTAALPPALIQAGIDVRLFLPGLPAIMAGIDGLKPVASLGAAFGSQQVRVLRGQVADSNVPAYVLDAPGLFDRPGNPYVDAEGQPWPDNHRRFALLGWAAARFADRDFRPDVIHAHDWHAGLAPAWLATRAGERPASMFTIHNLAYQGLVPRNQYDELGLPRRFLDMHGLEYHGQASFMKGGLYYADCLTTVSPTYAREIQQPEQGQGLNGLLAARSANLHGILNGVDYDVWSPEVDAHLDHHYGVKWMGGKAANKKTLQKELGLKVTPRAPMCCVVSRLTDAKGLDLVLGGLRDLIAEGGQLALLGSGDRTLEAAFSEHAAQAPDQVAVRIGYDERLSHRLIAAADIILVPSRSEPCGLTQLYGLRYGTLPLVARVGGLADTVIHWSDDSAADATGFVFDHHDVDHFVTTLRQAFQRYRAYRSWAAVRRRAMLARFGWPEAALQYADLYSRLRAPHV